MAQRQYDCMDICPEAYNLLSSPNDLAEALGCADFDDFMDLYEMSSADLTTFKNKLKYWKDVVPSSYGEQDAYIIPIDIMTGEENMVMLDLNDMVCDGENGSFYVFLLSTEDWGMM